MKHELELSEISSVIKCSQQHVSKIIKCFLVSQVEFLEKVNTRNLTEISRSVLRKSIDEIIKNQTQFFSVKQILHKLQFKLGINFKRRFNFRPFLRSLGFRFKKVKNSISQFKDQQLKVQKFLLLTLDLMSKKKLIFSFDVSTVGSDNLESKSWAKIGQSYRPPRSFQYDFLHMLAIINSTEFIAFQFVRGKITARVIGCFFVEAIARIRQTIPGSIRA